MDGNSSDVHEESADDNTGTGRWEEIDDVLVFERKNGFIKQTWDDLLKGEKKVRLVEKTMQNTMFIEPRSVITSLKWDSNLDMDDVDNYRQILRNNIHDTLNEVVHTSSYFVDLSRKLVLVKQFYDSRSNPIKQTTKSQPQTSTKADETTTSSGDKTRSPANPLESLAQVGCRFGLSFVFSFLRKAWRSGEDSDLCTELLEDTLMALVSLPPMSLFNQPLTPTWTEVLKRSVTFLKTISVSAADADASISEKDRQLSLRIILEVSLQRGSLSTFLDSILFLINLAEKRKQAADVSKNTELRGALLTPFLTQVKSMTDHVLAEHVPTNDDKARNSYDEDHRIKTNKKAIAADPNELLLKHVKLPDNEATLIDLKQASMISLAYVNALTLRLLRKTEEDEDDEKQRKAFKKMMQADRKKHEKWLEEKRSTTNHFMDNMDKKFEWRKKIKEDTKKEEGAEERKKSESSVVDIPLSCDLQETTFVTLDAILQKVACGTDNAWSPSQEQECMTVACLNITALQLAKALQLNDERLKDITSWKVMTKIRNTLLHLVTKPGVVENVCKAAQRCLTFGWRVLLPTVSDLVQSLLNFLSQDDAMEKEIKDDKNEIKKFLPELLSQSIRDSVTLHSYWMDVVESEIQLLHSIGTEHSDLHPKNHPAMNLFTQIFKNLLRHKKKAIEKETGCRKNIHEQLLSQFQTFLTSSLLSSKDQTTIEGLTSLFRKFLVVLCQFVCDIIDAMVEKTKCKTVTYKMRRRFANHTFVDEMKHDGSLAILSSMVTSIMLLQSQGDKVHFSLELSDYQLLIKTFQKVESFNKAFARPCLLMHDMESLTWPGVYSIPQKEKDGVDGSRILRKDEIDNHNIEGGRWIVKDGCVYDEINHEGEVGDSCELVYVGDYLSPEKDKSQFEDCFGFTKYCLKEYFEAQCNLAIIISSGLNNIYKNAGMMKSPLKFEHLISSKLFSGGKASGEEDGIHVEGSLGTSSVAYNMSRTDFDEKIFLWSLLDDVLEKETASVNVPDLAGHTAVSRDAVNAAKLFVAHIDKMNKRNQVTAMIIQQKQNVHMFGRFLLMALLKHHDLVNCAMTFAMHHDRDMQMPPAIQEVLTTVTQAQTKVIHLHQATRRSYEDICKSAIDRLDLLLSLNSATPHPFLEPIAEEMLQPISRWKRAGHKLIQRIRIKKTLKKLSEQQQPANSNDDDAKQRNNNTRADAEKMIWKEKMNNWMSLLLDVSLDPRKRKKLACRMNGKMTRRFDRSLSTAITSFALVDDMSPSDLSELDNVLLNCRASVNKGIEAAQAWKSLMQDEYQTMSVKYCLMLGWTDFVMAIQKKDKINCVEPENDVTTSKKTLNTSCTIKLDMTRAKSVEVFKFKLCQNQLAECITGFLHELLTSDKLLLTKDRFECSKRLFRRNISLDTDNNPLCRKLDDAFNISVTTRFFVLFVHLLHSSDSPHLLSHVWRNGSHALLHHLAAVLATALPLHVLERVKNGNGTETKLSGTNEANQEKAIASETASSSQAEAGTSESSTPVEYWHSFATLSDTQTSSSSTSVSLEADDDGGLIWKSSFANHPIVSMMYMTSWLLQDLYMKSSSNFQDTTFVRCLSGKLCDLLKRKYNTQTNALTVMEPLFPWTTLQFASAMTRHSAFWNDHSSKAWIELLTNLIGKDFAILSAGNLLDRLSALRIFKNILKHADAKFVTNLSNCPVNYLFIILGQLLMKQTKLQGHEELILNDNLLVPSNSESVASHVIDIIRCLHNTSTWCDTINTNISNGLQLLARRCHAPNTTDQDASSEPDDFSFVLASLAVLGMACDVMHIGQTVRHKEWSLGVITEISQKEKVIVYFKSLKEMRNCQVKNLEICCERNNACLLFPWTQVTEQIIVDALKLVLHSTMSDKNHSSMNSCHDNVTSTTSNENFENEFMAHAEIERHQLFAMLLRTLPILFRNKALVKGILKLGQSSGDAESIPPPLDLGQNEEERHTNEEEDAKNSEDCHSKTSLTSSLDAKSIELAQEIIKQVEEESASCEEEALHEEEVATHEEEVTSSSLAMIGSLQRNIVTEEAKPQADEEDVKKSEADSESFVSTTSDQPIVDTPDKSISYLEDDVPCSTGGGSLVPYFPSSDSSSIDESVSVPFTSYGDDNTDNVQNIIQELLSFATQPSLLKTEFTSSEKEDAFLVLLEALGSSECNDKLENFISDKFASSKKDAVKNSKSGSLSPRKSRRSRTERRQRHVQQIKFNEMCHDVEPRRRNNRATGRGGASALGLLARSYVDRLKPKPRPPSAEMRQLLEMGFNEASIRNAYTQLQKTSSSSLLPLWGDDGSSNPSLQEVISWLLEHPDQMNSRSSTPPAISSDDDFTMLDPLPADSMNSTTSQSSSDNLSDSSTTQNSDSTAQLTGSAFKTQHDFASSGEYAEYVRKNIKIGMNVVCCRPYEEVKRGFSGQVVSLDHDGLHDLNAQVYWDQKSGTYWVRYVHIQLTSKSAPSSPDDAKGKICVGDKVRVKRSVVTPKYKWGQVTPSSVGIVSSFQANGRDAVIKFREQPRWIAPVNELELVPVIHDNITCNACQTCPIEGYRYKCCLCADFNMCSKCFFTTRHATPRHVFNIIEVPGDSPRPVGPAGDVQKKSPRMAWETDSDGDEEISLSQRSPRPTLMLRNHAKHSSQVLRNHKELVNFIVASSSPQSVAHLWDGNPDTCWKSNGSAGKHLLNIHMKPGSVITKLVMQVNPDDSSYMPSSLMVSLINPDKRIFENIPIHVQPTAKHVLLLEDCTVHYDVIDINIKQCRNAGINCKIRGLEIQGYIDPQLIPSQNNKLKMKRFYTTAASYLSEESLYAYDAISPARSHKRSNLQHCNKHSLLKTKAWVWGLNDKDQLSGPRESKVKSPIFSEAISRLKVHQIIGGSKSLFVVTVEGKVYSCGESGKGRLGHGSLTSNVSTLTQIVSLSSHVVKKVAVHSGGCHCLAMTLQGRVFSWGDGEDGKLGHSSRADCLKPRLIETLKSQEVVDIACGSAHSAAVTSTGVLYTWGQGSYGRLGHGNNNTLLKPKPVRQLRYKTVTKVACGSRDAQTLCLTDDGFVYSWGDGDFGKLGRGGSNGCSVPLLITKLEGQDVMQIECGAQFSLALSRDGKVWTWGKGDYFRLGHGTDEHVRKPQQIPELKDKMIVNVAVGALHCLVVTDKGEVYSWGDNDHGQQGNGTTAVNRKPSLIMPLCNLNITNVACGSSHSVAWSISKETEILLQPILYKRTTNKLGVELNHESTVKINGTQNVDEDSSHVNLSTSLLHLATQQEKRTALRHVQRSLQIDFARSVIGQLLSHDDNDDSSYPISEENVNASSASSCISEQPNSARSSNRDGTLQESGTDVPEDSTVASTAPQQTEEDEDQPGCSYSAPVLPRPSSSASPSNVLPIHSDPAMVSLIAETITRPEEIVMPTPKKRDRSSSADDKSLIDVVLEHLTPKDATKITNLLRLILHGKIDNSNVEGLKDALRSMILKDQQVCDVLLEECINELEEIIQTAESLAPKIRPYVEESQHPYPDDVDVSGRVKIQGASHLSVIFDRQCSTEPDHDILTIYKGDESKSIASLSGRDWSNWCNVIHVEGNEIRWRFKSDASVNGWGWKFTVHPSTAIGCDKKQTSHRAPLLEFVSTVLSVFFPHGRPPMTALVSCMTESKKDLVSQLVQWLSSCMQVSLFGVEQRMWAIQQLRCLLDCCVYAERNSLTTLFASIEQKSLHNKHTTLSFFSSFIKVLPDILLCQYNYEAPEVQCGKQLMHSNYMKDLVSLACDMHLEAMISPKDRQRLSSMMQFFVAMRTMKALVKRSTFPPQFLKDVSDKLEGMHVDEDVYCDTTSISHEDNRTFNIQMDQQLVQWINKRPDDWSQMWGGSRQIFGWGHNHRGQLGGIEGAKVKIPAQCSTLSSLRPVLLVGGEQTLYIVTADGKVYATGYGASGRLGIGTTESIAVPTLLESIQHVHIISVAVNSGGKHILALSSDGEVYSWGEGAEGKLGHGTRTSCDRPRIIESLRGVHVVAIAAGGAHSAAIAKTGELYTWGKGRYGRLGHGDSEDRLKPKLVEALKGYHVMDVSCGNGDAQTLCITKTNNHDNTVNTQVWSWGDGDYGKLGRDGSDGCKIPMQIPTLQDKQIISVKCGSQFSLALSRTGLVYTWGKGDYFRLGHNSDQHVRLPKVIEALRGKRVIAVSTGSLHCVVCTSDGAVYTWGDNDEGQVGDGSLNAAKEPREIVVLHGKSINRVACGSAHSIAWSTGQHQPASDHNDLPDEVPMEFNDLQNVPMAVLRNRLVLLNYFSEIFCPWIALIKFTEPTSHTHTDIASSLDNSKTQLESDVLRSLLVTSGKECVFKKVVQSTMLRDKQHGPVIELNRIQVKRQKENGSLSDHLKAVFSQVQSRMSSLLPENILLPHRVWKVKFVGESVDDCGGGYSESVAEMCEELQDGSLPLLIPTPNALDEAGANRDCFLLNPIAEDDITTQQTDMFKFLGILFGIAIRTGSPLSLNIAEPVWKQISNISPTLQDISEVDKEFLPRLMFIRDADEETLESMMLPFAIRSSTGKDIPLSTKHEYVTIGNRNDYIRLSLSFRLHEFDHVISLVRDGMSKVIPLPLLILFTHQEVQTMVCGNPTIPLSLLKSVASFKGTVTNDNIPVWFWEVMEEMTNEERSLFLRFVWGRTRLPRTIADFRGRDFVIQILDKYNPPDYYLPESYTCFFLLKLPRYSCKFVLEQKLKYAIHFCKSIDTDEYARLAMNDGDNDDYYEDSAAIITTAEQLMRRNDRETDELLRPMTLRSRTIGSLLATRVRRFLRDPTFDDDFLTHAVHEATGESTTSGPDSSTDDNDDYLPII